MLKVISYTSTRVKAINNKNYLSILAHNLRKQKSKSVQNNKNNILIFKDNFYNFISYKDIKEEFKEIEAIQAAQIEQHKKDYQQRYKSSLKNGTHAEGVLTFSTDILERVNEQQLLENGLKTIKDIAAKLNTKIIYITLHMGEKTPHFHYVFENIAANKKSLLNSFEKKKLGQELQDIANKHFAQYGIKRGIKREHKPKSYNYKKASIYNQEQEQKQELKLRNIAQEYTQNYTDLEQLNIQLKELRNVLKKDTETATETKKELYKDITTQQEILRTYKEKIKELQKIPKEKTNKEIEEIFEKNAHFLFDIKQAKQDIKNKLFYLYKIIDQKEQEIIQITNEKEQENKELKKENKELKDAINNLINNNNNLELENINYKKQIKNINNILKNNNLDLQTLEATQLKKENINDIQQQHELNSFSQKSQTTQNTYNSNLMR